MSDKSIDVEVVKQPDQSQALAVRSSGAVGQALGVDEIIAQVQLIQNVMHRVMKEGEHYGKIPGCGDKATLLQPGAQKLTMTFRLCPEYEIQEVNIDRGHKEYRVICTLKSMGSGAFVGQGVGCCSTMESKYRWRGGARKCPKCGKESIIMGKRFKPSDPEPGWLCWTKKGGCGATWPKGATEIEGQSVEKVENDNPADHYNTVLKMAKKRAFVDATITATAASDIFTQDIDDTEEEPPENPPPRAPAAPREAASPVPSQRIVPPPAAAPAPASATPAYRLRMIEQLKAAEGQPSRQIVTEFFQKVDPAGLLPNETLEELPLAWVPVSKEQLHALAGCITAFGNGEQAHLPYPVVDASQSTAPKPTAAPAPVPAAAARQAAPKVPKDDEAWRDVIIPVPRKGQRRDDYLKQPDTIGSLFDLRHGSDDEAQAARQRLWGFVEHYEAKGWTGHDGKERPASASDIQFREALDQFAAFFEKHHPGEQL